MPLLGQQHERFRTLDAKFKRKREQLQTGKRKLAVERCGTFFRDCSEHSQRYACDATCESVV